MSTGPKIHSFWSVSGEVIRETANCKGENDPGFSSPCGVQILSQIPNKTGSSYLPHQQDLGTSPLWSNQAFPESSSSTFDLPTAKLRHEPPRANCDSEKDTIFVCDICDGTVVGQENFLKHLQEHTGKGRLQQSVGPGKKSIQHRQVTHQLNQLRVNRTKPKDKYQKDFHCKLCGMAFSRRDSLSRHRFTHTGEKRHQCPVWYQSLPKELPSQKVTQDVEIIKLQVDVGVLEQSLRRSSKAMERSANVLCTIRKNVQLILSTDVSLALNDEPDPKAGCRDDELTCGKSICFRESHDLWEDLRRNNEIDRLGECFIKLAQDLFFRLRTDSVTAKEKMSILNFLCQNGALKVDMTVRFENEKNTERRSKLNVDGKCTSTSYHLEYGDSEDYNERALATEADNNMQMCNSDVSQTTEGALSMMDHTRSLHGEEPIQANNHACTNGKFAKNNMIQQMNTERNVSDMGDVDIGDERSLEGAEVTGQYPVTQSEDSEDYSVYKRDIISGYSHELNQGNANYILQEEKESFPDSRNEKSDTGDGRIEGTQVKEEKEETPSQSCDQEASVIMNRQGTYTMEDREEGDTVMDEKTCHTGDRGTANRRKKRPRFHLPAEQLNHETVTFHMCEVCGKAFRGNTDLIRHKRTHTGEKPFQCRLCGKHFAQLGNMRRHEQWHLRESMKTQQQVKIKRPVCILSQERARLDGQVDDLVNPNFLPIHCPEGQSSVYLISDTAGRKFGFLESHENMESTKGVAISLHKTINLSFAEDSDRSPSADIVESSSRADLPRSQNGLHEGKLTCFQECTHLWEEVKRTNQVKRLCDCFAKVTQELFHRLRNDTLTSKEKLTVVNFLCESGALQMDVTLDCKTDDSRRHLHSEAEEKKRSLHESLRRARMRKLNSQTVTYHENGTYSVIPQEQSDDVAPGSVLSTSDDLAVEGAVPTGAYTATTDDSCENDSDNENVTPVSVFEASRRSEFEDHTVEDCEMTGGVLECSENRNENHDTARSADNAQQSDNPLYAANDESYIRSFVFPKIRSFAAPKETPMILAEGVKSQGGGILPQTCIQEPLTIDDRSETNDHFEKQEQEYGASLPVDMDGQPVERAQYVTVVPRHGARKSNKPAKAKPKSETKKRLACEICNEGFDFRSRLVSHMRVHTGEKPFKCDVCGKQFTQKGSLTVHQRSHTGENPYKCEYCAMAFSTRSKLISHWETHAGGKTIIASIYLDLNSLFSNAVHSSHALTCTEADMKVIDYSALYKLYPDEHDRDEQYQRPTTDRHSCMFSLYSTQFERGLPFEMETAGGVALSLRKTINFTFTTQGDLPETRSQSESNNASAGHRQAVSLPDSGSPDSGPSSTSHPSQCDRSIGFQEECFQLWEEIRRTNQVQHLGNCFRKVTQELFNRLSTNTLSSKEKMAIMSFLQESGAVRMDVVVGICGEENNGQLNRDNKECRQQFRKNCERKILNKKDSEFMNERENDTYSIDMQPVSGYTGQKHENSLHIEGDVNSTRASQGSMGHSRGQEVGNKWDDGISGLNIGVNNVCKSEEPSSSDSSCDSPQHHLSRDTTAEVNFVESVRFPNLPSSSAAAETSVADSVHIKEERSEDLFRSCAQSHDSHDKTNKSGHIKEGQLLDTSSLHEHLSLMVESLERQRQSIPFSSKESLKRRLITEDNGQIKTNRRTWEFDSHIAESSYIPVRVPTENIKPYQCKECGKQFSQSGNLRVHERIHTGERPYECEVCGKAFRTSDRLVIHRRTHTGEKPFECMYCGKRFNDRSNLNTHQRSHCRVKASSCNKPCVRAVIRDSSCDSPQHHLSRDTTAEVNFVESVRFPNLPSSSAAAETSVADSVHIKEERSEDLFRSCARSHDSHDKTNKSGHIKEGQLLDTSFLHEHLSLMVESLERQRQSIPFSSKESLKRRLITEDNGQIKTNRRTWEFDSHIAESSYIPVRVPTENIKPYQCKECGKQFSQSGNLRVHERIHTGERPYECEVCGKAFRTSDRLVIHRRTHTGEKPFECMYCRKRFNDRSNLNTHQRSHCRVKASS
ncbi:uncharacterized protein [Ptychodera flava]|uniref:uncharacterized protein n=1 Tax=Ptychodera flava TaxID=63121 RepID=UPI00396A9DDC